MTDKIVTRYLEFWEKALEETDFAKMAKVLRAITGYIRNQYGDISDYCQEIGGLIIELEKYLPLMDLDEFDAATRAIHYGQRAIRTSGDPVYAGRLSVDISDIERASLGESILESDRVRHAGLIGEGPGLNNDLLDPDSDDNGDE